MTREPATRDLLTAAEMRTVEAAAMKAGSATGLELMERAGAACAEAGAALCGGRSGRAVVLCGPGANGGDGYVVARRLAERGWSVEVFAFGDPAKAPPDAAEARRRWEARGATRPLAELPSLAAGADLLVDALFGTGFTRAAPDEIVAVLEAAEGRLPPRTLAVDAPLGLSLDEGVARGEPLRADLTVTFHRAKRGHYVGDGPALCGRVVIADIGTEGFALESEPARLVAGPTFDFSKAVDAHKYAHGHALVTAGGPSRGGAARMAARAALRVGAGAVTLLAPEAAQLENAGALDAVMLRACDGPDDLRALMGEKVTSILLGPGLGRGEATRALVMAALDGAAEAGRAVVLDADALTSFEEEGRDAFFAAARGARVVMTPHAGEFARLFPEAAKAPGRIEKAVAAAAESGATVLLKGPDTIIATPEGAVSVNAAVYERAAPWLATAGAGDVLAGFVSGLMARGAGSREAAETAAWLHVEAAREFGPGLIAEDLTEALPTVLRRARA